jgi:hypothetical protein
LRPAIEIAQLGARRRSGRRFLHARLHEDEPLPRAFFLLLLDPLLLDFLGGRPPERQETRAKEQQESDHAVGCQRPDELRAAGEGSPDRGFVLVAILEVEMYQTAPPRGL